MFHKRDGTNGGADAAPATIKGGNGGNGGDTPTGGGGSSFAAPPRPVPPQRRAVTRDGQVTVSFDPATGSCPAPAAPVAVIVAPRFAG